MPMLVPLPRNESVLRDTGPYLSGIDLNDRRRTAVQRAIRRAGLAEYEPETQATLLALTQVAPRPAEFFDIGAHIGLYSAMIAAIYPPEAVRVTAFEPTPDTAKILSRIKAKNALDLRIERCALGASEGEATLFVSDKAETSNSLVEGFRDSSASVTVPLTTLDAYCRRTKRWPSVVKIDVETYETYVLEGAMGTLRTARPAVVCELLPSAAPERTEQCLRALTDIGYHLHFWDTLARRWTEAPLAEALVHRSASHRDWLFAPEPLRPEFVTALAGWLAAISECTVERNVHIERGAPMPVGWGLPYRVPAS